MRGEDIANGCIFMSKYDRIQALLRLAVVLTEGANRRRRGEVALFRVDVLIGRRSTE